METKFLLRKDRSTHSISIISMLSMPHAQIIQFGLFLIYPITLIYMNFISSSCASVWWRKQLVCRMMSLIPLGKEVLSNVKSSVRFNVRFTAKSHVKQYKARFTPFVRSNVRFNVRYNVKKSPLRSHVRSHLTRANKYSRWVVNVSMITLWFMGITLCLILLNKHIKENRNSVSTYLLRYSLLITSIYLG